MNASNVSVVIPNYNHARYLPQCLDAVFAQQPRADEVIVIDDASTDDSVAVIESYRQRHPELRLLRNSTNQGVIAGMNRGLREARGEFVLFAAADDWVLPGMLSRSLELLQRYPQAGFCSSLSLQGTDASEVRPLPTAIVLDRAGYISPAEVLRLLSKEDSWFLGNTLLLRRERIIEMGGYRPELASYCDGFLYQQIALRHGVCFIPQLLSVWRLLPAGYSASTVIDVDKVARIRDSALRLMTTEFSDLFPQRYVRCWQRRWSYVALNGALRGGWNATVLERLWPEACALDRALLSAAARAGTIGRVLAKAYLSVRLRLPDLPTLVRRRIRWLLHAGRYGAVSG